VLLELGAKVFTIERQRELYLKAQKFLLKLGYHPHFFYGDGYLGKPTYGPFDKILITAGAPNIPELLLKQLKNGGIMVVPVGENTQKMMRIIRLSDDEFQYDDFGDFAFVPLLKGTAQD
jgi:protein-L-isoaspartate(D-aspartate) O-methyltransferase